MLEDPTRALAAGTAAAAAILMAMILVGEASWAGLADLLPRILHVGAAAVWLGLIWFVNFIQLPALAVAADSDRSALLRLVVPRVARTFQLAAHLTLLSGAALIALAPSQPMSMLDGRGLAFWAGIIGGAAMWAIVQLGIAPRVAILSGAGSATPELKAAAAREVRSLARINLVIAVPVTGVMIAAVHLH